jgi:hypothetical protein
LCIYDVAPGDSMVLNAKHLRNDFNLSAKTIKGMKNSAKLYSSLAPIREKIYNQTCKQRLRKVKDAESMHYQTLEFEKNLQQGNTNRALSFLAKVEEVILPMKSGGMEILGNGQGTLSRAAYVRNRDERLRSHEQSDSDKRREAQSVPIPTVVIRSHTDSTRGMTLYGALGVSQTASYQEIQKAFMTMERLWHSGSAKVRSCSCLGN